MAEMAMLENQLHPSRGCSCADCLRRWPEPEVGDGYMDPDKAIAADDNGRAWPQAPNE